MIDITHAPGTLPHGRRVYAIGDVHGCADRLSELHHVIAEDLVRRPIDAPLLIHIGDYVDRGPDSAGVVRLLAAGPPLPGVPTVNLMGNHEDTMLRALDGERASATDWLFTGGREALASWEVDPDSPREGWLAALPPSDVAFVRGLSLWHREGGYLFVHAGIRAGVPMERQERQDLLTIRQPFLTHESPFGFIVVHGHTPTSNPAVKPNRIGIDTGAVFGGRLTCVVLEGDTLGFLRA
jgi:calcineurin-like phosphoesterase family protein